MASVCLSLQYIPHLSEPRSYSNPRGWLNIPRKEESQEIELEEFSDTSKSEVFVQNIELKKPADLTRTSIKFNMHAEILKAFQQAQAYKFDVNYKTLSDAFILISKFPDSLKKKPRILIAKDGEVNFLWKKSATRIEISLFNKGSYSILFSEGDSFDGLSKVSLQDEIPAIVTKWLNQHLA